MTTRPRLIRCFLALLMIACGSSGSRAGAAEQQRVDAMGRGYFLYTPARIEPGRTYWLLAGIHGRGGDGKGACDMGKLAEQLDCIVVGPNFPAGHKVLAERSDEQLLALAASLSKEFTLHPRFFVSGFSAGAQFAHRFALKYPERVIGCAAHSAGCWVDGPDGGADALPPLVAGMVPFVISCGEDDVGMSTRDELSPPVLHPRIEAARAFDAKLVAKRFFFKSGYWPKVAHQQCADAIALTVECFSLATTGLDGSERAQVDALLSPVERLASDGDRDAAKARLAKIPTAWAELRGKLAAAPRPAASGWHENPAMRTELARRADDHVTRRIADATAKAKAGHAP